MNPLDCFEVDPATLGFVGDRLERPECILAERDGTLWVADARGGITRIDPDGAQALILQGEPNPPRGFKAAWWRPREACRTVCASTPTGQS